MLVLILCAVAVAVAALLAAGAYAATVVLRPRLESGRLATLERLADRLAGEISARAAQIGIQVLEQSQATRDHVTAEMARRRRTATPQTATAPLAPTEATGHPSVLPEGVTALQPR
jgi:hypothetical protein